MFFLGTGAAELMPNPFCNCEFCNRLRSDGECPRKRSATLLDRRNMVDFGPDVLASAQMYGRSLYDVDNLFITHTHEDHLSFENLEVLTMTPSHKDKPLHVWVSEKGYEYILSWMKALGSVSRSGTTGLERLIGQGVLCLHAVRPYTHFSVDGTDVFAVETNHPGTGKDEYALSYVFTYPDAHKILYALDTGLFSKENLQTLRDQQIGTVVTEGTFGSLSLPPDANHMTCESLVLQMDRFLEYGVISRQSVFYITHINQRNRFNHQEYQAWMDAHAPVRTIVAWDGLETDPA